MLIAYIGMGANLPSPAGTPAATLRAAAARMTTLGSILRRSSLYSTAPVGFADQPHFLNAVIELQTTLSPRTLIGRLLDLELDFGRDRALGAENGPRTLDLDILMMGDLYLCESDLEIPHPRLAERAFVLVPLGEIASQAIEPRHRATIGQLLERLRARDEAQVRSVVPIHDPLWDADAGDAPAGGSGQPHRHG